MMSIKLVFGVYGLIFGCANSQFNTFYPNNPFLNNFLNFGQNNQNFNQNSPNFNQNQQNLQQNQQNFNQNQQKPQNFQQSNFYFPSNPVVANNKPLNQEPNSNIRISERKCNEYWESSRSSVLVGSLLLHPVIQTIQSDSCDSSQGLIIGGENAQAEEFPHMAALGYRNLDNEFTFICGGSLISDQFVLTAAHCRREKPTIVRLGALNLKNKNENSRKLDVKILSYIIHENYDPNTNKNDIAVMKLASKIKLSKYIRPACLLSPNERVRSEKAIATGWGLTNAFYGDSSDVLQKVELSVISNRDCRRFLDDQDIQSTQLCAGEEKGEICDFLRGFLRYFNSVILIYSGF